MQVLRFIVLAAIGFTLINGFGPLCNNFTKSSPIRLPHKPNAAPVKVAFMGDQGISTISSYRVLEYIRAWGADPLVILGDFDYRDSPNLWRTMLFSVLGPNYPILAVGGNHDVSAWSGYAAVIQESLRNSGLDQYCTGELGVDMVCDYKDIVFILNQVGTQGSISDYVASTEAALSANQDRPWKFCGWHKNQHVYQTGAKEDETGFEILDTCRRYGAPVITAHEHSYSRSVLMADFAETTIVEPKQVNDLQLEFGRSFITVTGLGGKDIREWVDNAEFNPWWASCASYDNGVSYGALLCTIDTASAECRLVDIQGYVWDVFTIKPPSNLNAPIPPPSPCSPKYFELGVSEDSHQIGSYVFHWDRSMSLTESGQVIALRFTDVAFTSRDSIRGVHLQVFGFAAGFGSSSISIRAELTGDSSSLDKTLISNRVVTQAEIVWEKNDGSLDWEEREVWVSPNLKPLLDEVISRPDWKSGQSLTLIIQGTGASRHFFTRDQGICLAPTLSISLASPCKSFTSK